MRDGHYHCGDVATVDDEGYLTYVGRMDDVFKSLRLPHQPLRAGERAHRARGRGRGGGRAQPGSAAG